MNFQKKITLILKSLELWHFHEIIYLHGGTCYMPPISNEYARTFVLTKVNQSLMIWQSIENNM